MRTSIMQRRLLRAGARARHSPALWARVCLIALAACGARPVAAEPSCASWRPAEVGPRIGHSMAYDAQRQRLVVYGGRRESSLPADYLGDTWEWDGQRWELRSTAAPSPRSDAAMAYDPVRGVIVLNGGSPSNGSFVGDTWEWDGERWREVLVPGPPARFNAAMAFDPARGVCSLVSGWGAAESPHLHRDMWEWNGAQWSSRTLTFGAEHHTLASDTLRSRIWLWSRDVNFNYWNGVAWASLPGPGATSYSDGELAFDSARGVLVLHTRRTSNPSMPPWDTWEWNEGWALRSTTGPDLASGFAVAYDAARHETVALGRRGQFTDGPLAHVTWDGAAWTDRSPVQPDPLANTTMAYDSVRGVAVRFGGRRVNQQSQATQDTWEFDGEHWAFKSSSGPGKLREFAMAFDRRRGVTVLFGGIDESTSASSASTWEWNGVAWTERAIPGPGIRTDASMAFDEARGVIVLYGSSTLSDTWEFNGDTWALRSLGGGPLPTDGAPLVYDPDRQRCVLFGGGFLGYATWDWDGVSWTLADIDGPPPLMRSAVVYDRDRHVFVTYGGGQQWEWDRAQWRRIEIPVSSSPGARTGAGFVYDEARHAALLHSGSTNGPSRQTWYYGDDLLIVEQPAPASVETGERATFTIRMSGARAYTFAWTRDGVPLANGQGVSGADGRTLTIEHASLADRGEYAVTVSLACGAVVSAPALLSVSCTGDANGDGLVNFLDLNIVLGDFGAVAPDLPGDLDGDGDCDFHDLNILLGAYGVTC